MKSTLRSCVTAAMLLAPLGAFLSAQPAAAQHATVYAQAVVAPQPLVEHFVMRTAGALEPGREVRFRLEGAAGGQAWLDVPGVLHRAPMAEVRPGVYVASHVIRWSDHPDSFTRAVATFQSEGGQWTSARVQADGRGDGWGRPRRDDSVPEITQLTPQQGERVRERRFTRISARLSDEGSGIDRASVRLRVDGRDVTRQARVEHDEVGYREDLAPGRHTAELIVRDRAGNTNRKLWSFVVVDRDDYYGWGYGRGYYGMR